MGEKKAKQRAKSAKSDIMQQLHTKLVDEGKPIAAGFALYRARVMSPYAGETQVRECMLAFMAGAQHLFATTMQFLDEGEEPTEDDLRRLGIISDELEHFAKTFMAENMETKGNA
jgi:hypothetical protein